jgi:hypothetical protein
MCDQVTVSGSRRVMKFVDYHVVETGGIKLADMALAAQSFGWTQRGCRHPETSRFQCNVRAWRLGGPDERSGWLGPEFPPDVLPRPVAKTTSPAEFPSVRVGSNPTPSAAIVN